jgi:hypothetical protein
MHFKNIFQVEQHRFQGCDAVLLITANIVPSLLILFTLMMEAILSFETLILTRATWHHIPEDSILHSHCRENLKFKERSDYNDIVAIMV